MKKPVFSPRTCAAIAALVLAAPLPGACARAEEPVFSPPGTFLDPGHFIESGGEALYRSICQACHMTDGKGAAGAGSYPALAANVRLSSADYPVLTVLRGRHGMPPFGFYLSDQQVADVVNYVRSHFDNHNTDQVSATAVAVLRNSGEASP
jgi:cytochrome c5